MTAHLACSFAKRFRARLLAGAFSVGLLGSAGLTLPSAVRGQATSTPLTTWAVTIVLPPKIVAGQPATFAAFGVDGRLASGVTVDVGGQKVTTDRSGRGHFTAPTSGGYLFAKASGGSFAALVDSAPPAPARGSQAIAVAPVISLHDRFSICGAGLSGDADENRVKINDRPNLVLAASPECIVVLPGPKVTPGSATISVAAPGLQASAAAAIVSLEFEPPNPALLPGKQGNLAVRVQGSAERLQLVVENKTPGVLRFLKGDAQEVVTGGGSQNFAEIKVQAITSGDFSFHARLVPAPDVEAARRYLEAAASLAPENLRGDIKGLASRLSRHPRDFEKIARALDDVRFSTMAGDFRTLLDAASGAL
jgi:hypothetical protein